MIVLHDLADRRRSCTEPPPLSPLPRIEVVPVRSGNISSRVAASSRVPTRQYRLSPRLIPLPGRLGLLRRGFRSPQMTQSRQHRERPATLVTPAVGRCSLRLCSHPARANSLSEQFAFTLPFAMTTTWSIVCAISASRCEAMRTAFPSLAASWTNERNHEIPSGSSPFVGSSSIRILGSPRSATASCKRWRIPSDIL